MAMIRGRKFQSKTDEELEMENKIRHFKNFGNEKNKPAASFKQQRRLTMIDGDDEKPIPTNEPIPEVDPFYAEKNTFLFLNDQKVIFRFSDSKSLFLLGKDNIIRKAFLRILVHNWFNYIVIATILINCAVMMVNGNNKPEWSELYVENIFLFIYTTEAVVKIVGRGFILHKFSYLRDPWNWLDFVVIVSGFVLIIMAEIETTVSSDVGSLTFLRAIRVLRIFKTVSVIPGLRMIVSALIASTKALKDAMLLSLLGFSMFSLVGIQVFRGTLRAKCILRPPWMLNSQSFTSDTNWELSGQHESSTELDNSSSSIYSMKFNLKYREQVLELFGRRAYEETLFLLNSWLNKSQNSKSSGGVFEGMYQSDDLLYPSPTYTTEISSPGIGYPNRSVYSGLGSGVNEAAVYSDWTYRTPRNEEFTQMGYTFDWNSWINNDRHHVMNGFVPLLCGNSSTAQKCPDVAICTKAGSNPNFGYTSFDNFPYAFLSVFRLSLQDNWEELYLQVLETSGQLSVLFFLIMILLGSYYLVNLILAVVASSYEDQAKSVQMALAEEKKIKMREREYLRKRRNAMTQEKIRRSSTRESISNFCGDCKAIFLEWKCCVGESFLCAARSKLKRIFVHPNAEMAVVGLVILNTLFMALEKEPKGPEYANFLTMSNIVFNSLFTIEMAGKMLALSPYHYFAVAWNTFDFIVVTLSLIEMVMSDKLPDGLAVLRTFRLIRLVRILKLARSWPTLSKIMSMIADSLSKLGYLTLVLLIVLIIFALAGMQTVGVPFYMNRSRGIPLRWHMNDFVHSFLIVFRIQCGEWIQSMWSCMHSVSEGNREELVPFCLLIFLGVVFVGNLVVLNLFLALLLNSFSGADLNGGGKSAGAQKFLRSLRRARAIVRITGRKRKVHPISAKPENATELTNTNGIDKVNDTPETKSDTFANISETSKTDQQESNGINGYHIQPSAIQENMLKSTNFSKSCNGKQEASQSSSNFLKVPLPDYTLIDSEILEPKSVSFCTTESSASITTTSGNDINTSVDTDKQSPPLTPSISSSSTPTNEEQPPDNRNCLQIKMNNVVQHWIFETFIIFCIMCSSIALVFEDVNLPKKPLLKSVLEVFDKIFMVIFFIEMIMKWIGFGFKKYFTNGWCILDFFIVMFSIVSLSLEIYAMMSESNSTDLSSLRVLRSLRAFRPLRAMSRFKGIKVVTDALFRSIPSILNVFVICLVFWLVFAIMGVNLFAGKMSACRWKKTGEKVWHPEDFKNWKNLSDHFQRPPIDVYNKSDCERLAELTGGKVHWKNLYANFDNVPVAYVSLMQVATFKGWMPIMYAAVDLPVKIGDQPIYENSVENYFFFVAFIIFGAFFTLNLFISVVIDNFNQQKSRFEFKGGELFLTSSQKKAYDMLKKLTARTPNKLIPVPKMRWRRKLHFIVTGDKFELTIMVATLLNLAVLALEHDDISTGISDVMEYLNYGFLGIFTIEIILRIVATGCEFFRSPWNVYDFLVIGTSLIVNVVSLVRVAFDHHSSLIKSPWLPMLRMIRIARILRVARVASGIRTLLFALVLSLPALVNVGSLLFLFMFIFAIFGMSQFGHVEHRGAMTDILNFETFPNAFMLLFQTSTSAGWDGFLEPTIYVDAEYDDCKPETEGSKGTCMKTSFIGYIYFISYLILTFVIITNMYIAIILENFEAANKDSAEPLTADDFEHYFDVWQKHDEDGSGQLTIEQLSSLLHTIDRPLRIPKPNMEKIAALEIPMNEKNEMHILDVGTALVRNVLGPCHFTEEMKIEVDSHFRKKAAKLMRNYSREKSMNSFEYAKNKKLVRQDAVEKLMGSPNTRPRSESNNSNRHVHSDISIVLHPAHDDVKTASVMQTSSVIKVESKTKSMNEKQPPSTKNSNCNSSAIDVPKWTFAKVTSMSGGKAFADSKHSDNTLINLTDNSVVLRPKHEIIKTASVIRSIDKNSNITENNGVNYNANSSVICLPIQSWENATSSGIKKFTFFYKLRDMFSSRSKRHRMDEQPECSSSNVPLSHLKVGNETSSTNLGFVADEEKTLNCYKHANDEGS
uniref:sodium channel protein type 4 subunit alpha B-like n=1 Tax=Styela clava TaxID=7725 RepID=UPI00193A0C30|nr:sodium channel protein type 4 subunit alpha B-like [Styela clava]